MNIVLHFGTVLALIIFFRKDILKLAKDVKLIGYILIVTAITGIIGILGKDFFESFFLSAQCVWLPFFVTGVILLSTKRFMKGWRVTKDFNLKDIILLGLVQSLAIIPGISRSGVTISLMLFLGLRKEEAFKFSFLASIPAVLGALILEGRSINSLSSSQIGYLSGGLLAAFVSGFLALFILQKLIHKSKFSIFGYYCILVSLIVLFLFR